MWRIIALALCLVTVGCGSSGTPHKQSKVTTAIFEPVYRAAKTVQGATQSGVSYVKFGEVMQQFSTELSIAKDHELNAADKKLFAHYQDAYDAYQFSKEMWSQKIEVGSEHRPGLNPGT